MCVIIAIPKGEKIENSEIDSAWRTNSDGAGYMYRDGGKVIYKRGFMDKAEYIEEVNKYMGKYDLVLHLRISTSDKVNPIQTHPYELGDVMNMEGKTSNPVVCMNGICSNDKLQMLDECNDTMSYIVQNNELFEQFVKMDDVNDKVHMINFIKEHSGAKWCVMTPETTYFSQGFTKEDNILYSNLNHRTKLVYSRILYKRVYMSDILNKKLIKRMNRTDKGLYNEVYDFISEYCNNCDKYCKGCLKNCRNVMDVRQFRKDNIYDFQILHTDKYGWYDFYDYTDEKDYNDSYKNEYIFDE